MRNLLFFTGYVVAGRKLKGVQETNGLQMFDPFLLPQGDPGSADADKSQLLLDGTGVGLWERAERAPAETGDADEKTPGLNAAASNAEEIDDMITYTCGADEDEFSLLSGGYYIVDLPAGGNNEVYVNGVLAHEIVGGSADDTIDIWGGGSFARSIDLTNGGNNGIPARASEFTIYGTERNDDFYITNETVGGPFHLVTVNLTNGGNNTVFTFVQTHIIGGAGNDRIISQPSLSGLGSDLTADLSAGGDNNVQIGGARSFVKVGAGNDTIEVRNNWNNADNPLNWSITSIDLSLGGTNSVDIRGNSHAYEPTVARITPGIGNDTIVAHEHTVVTILGANSTGNHNITLGGTAHWLGKVETGLGHTTINWNAGNYLFEFGSGDLTFTTGGDLDHRFVFDGSERTANDTLILNNWREGGVVHTGHGHTDVTLNGGSYDFHLGSGSVYLWVNGHQGFSTVYDADGNLIVGRVDGQSSDADAVHTFSAGDGINLQYSLELGGGVDKLQFYAGSGHYQVTSSASADIFQLDFGTGGTEGATFEVFDFKWGTDRIMAANGTVFDEFLLTDGHAVRLQYMGEENGQHVFDVVALWDFGAYDAGHVWMTVYSHDLPDLNFL